MPSPSLHAKLHDLASTFADAILEAIRTASLHELTGDGHVGNGRRARTDGGWRSSGRTAGGGGQRDPLGGKAKTTKGGRLARRSPEDIQNTLGLVVAALKGTRGKGMRAEEIRKFLNLDVREVPRVLKHGIATKKLKSRGRKRATTYFVQ